MPTRQMPLPSRWLMTDERVGNSLWTALGRLPRDGGVVLRHHATPASERRVLAGQVADFCRAHDLTLAVARDVGLAREVGAGLVHNPVGPCDGLPTSRSAHSIAEARAAEEAGAFLLFVSPLFATASHPAARPIGIDGGLAIVRAVRMPAIALGGMTEERGLAAMRAGFHGWAAIDAWSKPGA